MREKADRFSKLMKTFDSEGYVSFNKPMTFNEYLDLVYANPLLSRNAHQRLLDTVLKDGTETIKKFGKTITKYKFFDKADDPIFGLEEQLDIIVKNIKSAAGFWGTERRILLLCGPVGSSKSTILRALKRGLERYSNTDEGALYTYTWVNIPDDLDSQKEMKCPMHQDPLNLLNEDMRGSVQNDLNEILSEQCKTNGVPVPYKLKLKTSLNPQCQFYMDYFLDLYKGNLQEVLTKHIQVHRITLSEARRVGIGTFQPKDEKNQDSTELTGDINYRKVGEHGTDSDARAFSFDGEFEIANRGLLEFIEILKLAKEFLYDILGATQEQQVKPKKFAQVDIDLALIGHTNMPEFTKLQSDRTMEAFRDRTIKIDIPYLLEWSKERQILEHSYGKGKVNIHIAPHTLDMAALWSTCTRLDRVDNDKLSLVQKAKLYDNRTIHGWNEDKVKELFKPSEGLKRGVSPRYVQNKIAQSMASGRAYINPFILLRALEEDIREESSMFDNKEDLAHYRYCLSQVRMELDDVLKKEVQQAIVGDSGAAERLCQNYIDNMIAHVRKRKIKNSYTEAEEAPNERLMRSIESKIGVPDASADDFRRSIAEYIGTMSLDGKKFEWNSHPQLAEAFEKDLFEKTRDIIKVSVISREVIDKETQAKIDGIKQRLVDNFGYTYESATDILEHVSNILARGDVKQEG